MESCFKDLRSKKGPKKDHFSSLVLKRTKSLIKDLYASTEELGEKTKSSWSLQRHIREVHLRLRQKKKCPHCPKKISSRCMAGHIKRVH